MKLGGQEMKVLVISLVVCLLTAISLTFTRGLGNVSTQTDKTVNSQFVEGVESIEYPQNAKHTNESPVSVVRKFWEVSLEDKLSDHKDELIFFSPASFGIDSKRCGVTENLKNQNPSIDTATPEQSHTSDAIPSKITEGWEYKSVLSAAAFVRDNKFLPKSIEVESEFGNEAVVSVSYINNNLPGIATIYRYFFLFRNNGKWGIFMVTYDPHFNNPSYAGLNCNKT
jgi:hypothetical protein